LLLLVVLLFKLLQLLLLFLFQLLSPLIRLLLSLVRLLLPLVCLRRSLIGRLLPLLTLLGVSIFLFELLALLSLLLLEFLALLILLRAHVLKFLLMFLFELRIDAFGRVRSGRPIVVLLGIARALGRRLVRWPIRLARRIRIALLLHGLIRVGGYRRATRIALLTWRLARRIVPLRWPIGIALRLRGDWPVWLRVVRSWALLNRRRNPDGRVSVRAGVGGRLWLRLVNLRNCRRPAAILSHDLFLLVEGHGRRRRSRLGHDRAVHNRGWRLYTGSCACANDATLLRLHCRSQRGDGC